MSNTRIRKKCPHDTSNPGECKECPNNWLCDHGRRKSRCKDCEGSNICSHGNVKHLCTSCGGKSICEHGKRRKICRDCNGSSVCIHGNSKYKCYRCKKPCVHTSKIWKCSQCYIPLFPPLPPPPPSTIPLDNDNEDLGDFLQLFDDLIGCSEVILAGRNIIVNGILIQLSQQASAEPIYVSIFPLAIIYYTGCMLQIPAGSIVFVGERPMRLTTDAFGYQVVHVQPQIVPNINDSSLSQDDLSFLSTIIDDHH